MSEGSVASGSSAHQRPSLCGNFTISDEWYVNDVERVRGSFNNVNFSYFSLCPLILPRYGPLPSVFNSLARKGWWRKVIRQTQWWLALIYCTCFCGCVLITFNLSHTRLCFSIEAVTSIVQQHVKHMNKSEDDGSSLNENVAMDKRDGIGDQDQ